MQTRKQHWQVSKLGWLKYLSLVTICISNVAFAVDVNPSLPEVSIPVVAQEKAQIDTAVTSVQTDSEANSYFPKGNLVSPEQKVLLLKEQEIVSQTSTANPAAKDKDAAVSSAPGKGALKVYNSVPYSKPQTFASNPLVAGEVRLTYRPSVLDPMGEDKPKRSVIRPPEPPKPAQETAVAKKDEDVKPVVVVAPAAPKDPNPALTAFLEWVRSTQDAADIARKEVEKKTQLAKVSGTDGMFEKDMFLTIRFPYTGAEPPPGNTSVIYSEPPVVSP